MSLWLTFQLSCPYHSKFLYCQFGCEYLLTCWYVIEHPGRRVRVAEARVVRVAGVAGEVHRRVEAIEDGLGLLAVLVVDAELGVVRSPDLRQVRDSVPGRVEVGERAVVRLVLSLVGDVRAAELEEGDVVLLDRVRVKVREGGEARVRPVQLLGVHHVVERVVGLADAHLERGRVVEDTRGAQHPVLAGVLEEHVHRDLVAAVAGPGSAVRLGRVVLGVHVAAGDAPLVRGLEVQSDQVRTRCVTVRGLARVVDAAAGRVVRRGEEVESGEAGTIEAALGNPAQDAAVREARPLVARAAAPGRVRLCELIVADVGVRVAAVVDALREVPGPLEGGGHARRVLRRRAGALLELLAPEEEELLLVRVEDARDVDRAADGVAVVVTLRRGRIDDAAVTDRRRRPRPKVGPGVGVPVGPAAEPVARAVEGLGPALGHHLHLRAHRASVLRLVRVRQDLELADGLGVGGGHVAGVVAGVDVGDTVDRHVVGGLALAVHADAAQVAHLVAGVGAGGDDPRDQQRVVEQLAPVGGDALDRLALQRERALAALRLQLGDAAADAHFLRDRADLERHAPGGELVVRADLHVRPFEGLEALHDDLERVEVGTDDREDEAPLGVRRRGRRIALGPARQRHRRAGQDASLGVLHLAEDGRAGRLCGDRRCRKQTEAYRHRPAQGMATRSTQTHEALSFIWGAPWPPYITSKDKQLGPNSGFVVSRDAKNERGRSPRR